MPNTEGGERDTSRMSQAHTSDAPEYVISQSCLPCRVQSSLELSSTGSFLVCADRPEVLLQTTQRVPPDQTAGTMEDKRRDEISFEPDGKNMDLLNRQTHRCKVCSLARYFLHRLVIPKRHWRGRGRSGGLIHELPLLHGHLQVESTKFDLHDRFLEEDQQQQRKRTSNLTWTAIDAQEWLKLRAPRKTDIARAKFVPASYSRCPPVETPQWDARGAPSRT